MIQKSLSMTPQKAQHMENGHWNFEKNTHTKLQLPSELISEYDNPYIPTKIPEEDKLATCNQ